MSEATPPASVSIRGFLTVVLLVGAGSIVILTSLLLDQRLRSFLQERYDHDLFRAAQTLITLTKESEEGVELDFAGEFMPQFETAEGGDFFEIWLADDSMLEASESLAGGYIPVPRHPVAAPRYQDIEGAPLGRCRVLTLPFVPQREGPEEYGPFDEEGVLTADAEEIGDHADRQVTLLLARQRDEFDRFLHMIRAWIWGSQALLLVLIICLVRAALSGGLKPLTAIRSQVEAIDPRNLATRIHLDQPVDELTPVVNQLNHLLHRLEEAVVRERRFTSDVAHELRTPLAELRTFAEVGLRNRDDLAMLHSFLNDIHEVSLEMQQLVENLLELSRCDGGARQSIVERVDLRAVVQKAWSRAAESVDEGRLQLAGPRQLDVLTDRGMVEQIVQNLVNNALTHGADGGHISIDLAAHPRVALTVANPAPLLSESDLPLLFDRFWQKDSARTGGKNSGLGLAIVAAFSNHLGLDLTATLQHGQIVFTLTFPEAACADLPDAAQPADAAAP